MAIKTGFQKELTITEDSQGRQVSAVSELASIAEDTIEVSLGTSPLSSLRVAVALRVSAEDGSMSILAEADGLFEISGTREPGGAWETLAKLNGNCGTSLAHDVTDLRVVVVMEPEKAEAYELHIWS